MMNAEESRVAVLFMDDEVHDRTVLAVASAVEALEQRGHEVTVVDSMTKAIDAFFEKFYKVFVLDIDMSHVNDVLSGAGERGTRVAELYRALDNGTQVIMYSAMGRAEDWFRLANRHVFGYVDKGARNAVATLAGMVDAAAAREAASLRLPTPRNAGQVLVCGAVPNRVDELQLQDIVRGAGTFTAVSCRLDEAARRLKEGDFVAAVLVSDRFETSPPVPSILREVCGLAPSPHVVIACDALDDNLASIVALVNARPFRLVDLLSADWTKTLADAIRAAAACHGGDEVFEAETEFVRRAAASIDWTQLDEVFASPSPDAGADANLSFLSLYKLPGHLRVPEYPAKDQ